MFILCVQTSIFDKCRGSTFPNLKSCIKSDITYRSVCLFVCFLKGAGCHTWPIHILQFNWTYRTSCQSVLLYLMVCFTHAHRTLSWFHAHLCTCEGHNADEVNPGLILCFCTSFYENWRNAERCGDGWRCNHEGKRTEQRLLKSMLQWIRNLSTLLSPRKSLSGFLTH